MGCLKLNIVAKNQSTLKVVYRDYERLEKVKVSYYPYGLKHNSVINNPNPVIPNRYGFNSKELIEEMGIGLLDYGARTYDPKGSIFYQVDPLADEMAAYSPYAMAFNNPISYMDPDGRMPVSTNDQGPGDPPKEPSLVEQFVTLVIIGLEGFGGALNRQQGIDDSSFEENLVTGTEEGMMLGVELVTLGTMGTMQGQGKSRGNSRASTSVKSPKATTATKKVHGNSRNSTNKQHGYEITNDTKGVRHKVGISGGKLNKDGSSRRANSQVSKLNRTGKDKYSSKVLVKDLNSRQTVIDWEQGEVNTYYRNTGLTPAGQKRPKPK